jgi:exosortase A-associated hydrolase 2
MLHVAPFAEEMNRSRRVAALAARALARNGWTVLQIDLYGCGDSEGEFEDADWQAWLDDIAQAAQWLRHEHASTRLTLWGVRAGCLLASEATDALPDASGLLMWQPVASGAEHIKQLRRIHAASGAFRRMAAPAGSIHEAAHTSAPGGMVDLAGYRLSPALARGLASATLRPPSEPSHLACIHIGNERPEGGEANLQVWRSAGWRVDSTSVSGPPFWKIHGCAELPGLVQATVAMAAKFP